MKRFDVHGVHQWHYSPDEQCFRHEAEFSITVTAEDADHAERKVRSMLEFGRARAARQTFVNGVDEA